MRNKTAVISIWAIVICTLVACAGYLITPDSTPFANEQHLEIAAKKPGSVVKMLKIRNNDLPVKQSIITTLAYGRKSDYSYLPIASYRFSNDHILVKVAGESNDSSALEYSFLVQDVLYALADTSTLSKTKPSFDLTGHQINKSLQEMKEEIEQKNINNRFYLLGTDRFGRDVLSQLMIGTRVSLSVGFISVLISLIFGILLGALAGFFRGRVDDIIIWFINVIWSIPTLLLVIAITFALGKGFWQVFIAVGLTMWVEVARIVRGQIISLREKEFVEAARALGYKNFRIIFRHILPNTMGPVIVISAANFASAILIEAGLSFLGIGVQPPMPSWGTMVKENYAYIILDNPWLALIPGIAIMFLVLAFMLIGNALRDALDVKTNSSF
ncbi:MAG TPA: ABC transporter permease [Lentimicrobium sp.]|nr:ABC transporter permease [Lentimicrobium sp.]